MKIYIINEHWECTDFFVTKKIAEEELKKRRKECSSCKQKQERETEHSLEEYEAK